MITREDMVEQSITNFVRAGLTERGYGNLVRVREAFPTYDERGAALTLTQVAVGFNTDDGGRLIEMGTDLTQRIYTVEFWTFGVTHQLARNIAHVIRAHIEDAAGGLIPLRNVGVADQPVIDQLQTDDRQLVRVERQIAPNPRPWDNFVFTTTVRVVDMYYPSLVN